MKAIETIRAIVGASACHRSEEVTQPYIEDRRGHYKGNPLAVVFPSDLKSLQNLVRYCHHEKIGIVPQGGNTGYSGGAIPDGTGTQLVICLEKLNNILRFDPDGASITTQAGITLQRLREECARRGFLFPLDIGSRGSCQIGGNLATNAGGIHVLRYGMARDLVLGLEVVLPDGRVMSDLRALKKNNAGYDLKQLFVGSEGTLGIISAATLKITTPPTKIITAFAGFENMQQSVKLLSNLRTKFGHAITSFEFIEKEILEITVALFKTSVQFPFRNVAPYTLLFELSTHETSFEPEEHLAEFLEGLDVSQKPVDVTIAQNNKQAENLWKLRELLPETEKRRGASVKHDISIPTSSIPSFCREAKIKIAKISSSIGFSIFGHLGDGNLHFNVIFARAENSDLEKLPHVAEVSDRIYELVHKYGGSFSAEHGIGIEKTELLESYGEPVGLEMMRVIKSSFDPSGIMNPGKIFPV